jgi:hypothetical protein
MGEAWFVCRCKDEFRRFAEQKTTAQGYNDPGHAPTLRFTYSAGASTAFTRCGWSGCASAAG